MEDNSGVELESDDGTNTFQVLDSAISATANSGSGGLLTLNDTSASIGTSSTGVYIDTTAISLTTDALKIYGDSTSTVGELHFQEATTNGVNYIGFKAPTALSGNSTYTLPSSSSDGLMINSSSTLSWGTATNSHLSSGVGGIYKGSGIIPSGTSAKLTTSGSFEVTYSNTSTAFVADDTTSGAALQSRTNAHSIYVDDTQVGLSAPHTLLNSFASNAQELRFEEPAGINYTAFKAQNQSVDITYTLPAAAPASNGYVLSSTTGGTLSWVANGGADGNGIYTGSGTIASNAVATLTSGASFTIDFNGGNNAMWINDSTGAILIYDKTANCGVGMDNAGIGLYSGSDSFVLDESSGGAALNTDLRIYNGKLLLDSVSTPSQFTSNQNNYSLSATAAVLRVSTDASRNLTGIANSGTMQDGRVLTIVNVGSNNIVLTTEDTNSTAANRFALGESNVTLKASESLTVWYDTSTDRWRPISYQATTGGTTDLAFSGSSSPVTLTSSTGTDVTFTAGTGISLSASSSNITINSTATGDVLQNGNSFGAAMVIGTNDNNSLSFETNGVTRMSITSGASTGGAVTITNVNANTNTVQDVLTISANSSGTPLANYGTGILFQAKSATVDNRDIARISSYWTQPTDASREGALSFQLGDNAGALAEVMKLDRTTSSGILSIGSTTPVTISNAGITAGANYTIAAGSNNLLLNSTGTGITWIGTNSGGSEIGITSLGNNSNSANGITIGLSTSGTNSTYSQTTGTRNYLNFAYNFSPTSGTAVHNQLAFTGTFNQTGGANGITRSINIAPTITAVADYRALEIAANGTNVKGVYQSGSTTTNNFVGRTSFGTTSSPHASAAIDVVSTTTGVGLPTMTSTQRDAISSPRDGLLVYNSTDNAVSARVNGSWTNLGSGSSGFPTYSYNSQTGTTYTLVAGDAGDMVRASNASAITITVPANSSVAFAVGTMIYVEQTGAGAVTVSPAGGVTILSTARTTPSQYSVIQLYKIDTDT